MLLTTRGMPEEGVRTLVRGTKLMHMSLRAPGLGRVDEACISGVNADELTYLLGASRNAGVFNRKIRKLCGNGVKTIGNGYEHALKGVMYVAARALYEDREAGSALWDMAQVTGRSGYWWKKPRKSDKPRPDY